MSRRKTKKHAMKRQPSNIFSAISKMEKDFLNTPKLLAAQLKKETISLKQKDNKLKQAINKIKIQVRDLEKKVLSVASKKINATSKKQLALAKKRFNQSVNEQNKLIKESDKLKESFGLIADTQSKLTAMSKQLNQFQKDWSTQSINTSTAKKIKAKKSITKSNNSSILDDILQTEPGLSKETEILIEDTSEATS